MPGPDRARRAMIAVPAGSRTEGADNEEVAMPDPVTEAVEVLNGALKRDPEASGRLLRIERFVDLREDRPDVPA